ncbi:GvpT/GvpP family gas vesicle accessory protein [Gracilibacillus xinjiangensis]|uniref:GvpT/GvpP family gas vesicle accessory protein n=1 Tax=Gracilibacillus xinjiangensis TaxID=1193282 RepID=A0ABV8WU19_9BACI
MVEKQTANETKKMPLKRTITGGVLGATIGYLATPENSKRLIARINETEWKEKGIDLGKATKGKVAELKDAGKKKSREAYQRVKDSKVFNGEKNDPYEESGEDVTTELVNEESYLELKEENKLLQERLNDLEEKLNKIAITGEENNSTEKQNSQQSKGNSENANQTTNKQGNSRNNNERSVESESLDTAISNNDDTNS